MCELLVSRLLVPFGRAAVHAERDAVEAPACADSMAFESDSGTRATPFGRAGANRES